jgi:hypothetical protein
MRHYNACLYASMWQSQHYIIKQALEPGYELACRMQDIRLGGHACILLCAF